MRRFVKIMQIVKFENRFPDGFTFGLYQEISVIRFRPH